MEAWPNATDRGASEPHGAGKPTNHRSLFRSAPCTAKRRAPARTAGLATSRIHVSGTLAPRYRHDVGPSVPFPTRQNRKYIYIYIKARQADARFPCLLNRFPAQEVEKCDEVPSFCKVGAGRKHPAQQHFAHRLPTGDTDQHAVAVALLEQAE